MEYQLSSKFSLKIISNRCKLPQAPVTYKAPIHSPIYLLTKKNTPPVTPPACIEVNSTFYDVLKLSDQIKEVFWSALLCSVFWSWSSFLVPPPLPPPNTPYRVPQGCQNAPATLTFSPAVNCWRKGKNKGLKKRCKVEDRIEKEIVLILSWMFFFVILKRVF